MSNTLKVKTAGRYGARYGVGIRKKLLKIESKQRKYYPCPFCGAERVRRKAAGIYACRKCNNTFAGGAYLPSTLPGSIVQKMVAQRSFLPSMKELLSAKEEGAEEEAAEGMAEGKREWGGRASREIYRERREWRSRGRERRDFFGQGKESKSFGEPGKEFLEHGKDRREWKEHKPEEKEIGKGEKGKHEHKGKEIAKERKAKEEHKEEARSEKKAKEKAKEKKEAGKKK